MFKAYFSFERNVPPECRACRGAAKGTGKTIAAGPGSDRIGRRRRRGKEYQSQAVLKQSGSASLLRIRSSEQGADCRRNSQASSRVASTIASPSLSLDERRLPHGCL